MNLNRIARMRRVTRRKTGVISALTLGALVVSGGVAMASLDGEPEADDAGVSDTVELPSPDDARPGGGESDPKVCLSLDKEAQRAIAKAAAEVSGGTIRVPLSKVEVIPCKTKPQPDSPQPPDPDPTTPAPPESTPTPPAPPTQEPTPTPTPTPPASPPSESAPTPPAPAAPTTPAPEVTSAPS